MAVHAARYNCGCGYKTKSTEEAMKHSETKNHKIDILGQVLPGTSEPENQIEEEN